MEDFEPLVDVEKSDLIDVEQPDLVDVEHDWQEAWKGMGDYTHQDLMPKSSLTVHFRSEADRLAFQRVIDQQFTPRTKSIWFPKAEIGVAADKVWVSPLQLTPRHPIYIISKGRADTRLTSRALEWLKVPYHIVIEPQEYDQYAAVIDPKKILVLPFSNLGLGGIPARNWVWEHSISIGATRHWILDDNISGFCRFQDNMKIEFATPAPFCMVEDFVDRYENLVMAGFNYDYFAPRKAGAKISPITWNTRIYSGILLRNDVVDLAGNPIRWRGRYNEDTDLSLRILKDGLTASQPGRYSTALFNALLMYKKPTLTMKGGNATELYQGAEATKDEWETHAAACDDCRACTDGYGSRHHPCPTGVTILEKDGRWRMAESLFQQHPDCTTVERKWRRWQHQVDYRAFRDNTAVPKADAPPERDWQLSLIAKPAGWGEMRGAYMQRASEALASASATPPKPVISKPPASSSGPEKRKPERITAPEPPRAAAVSALDFIARMAAAAPTVEPARPAPEPPKPEPVAAQEKAPPAVEQPFSAPATAVQEAVTAGVLLLSPALFRDELLARGHRLLTREGKFFVSEAPRLSEADRAYIKANRDALIALAAPWEPEPPPELPEPEPSSLPRGPEDFGGEDFPMIEPQSLAPPEARVTFTNAGAPNISLAEALGMMPVSSDWRPEPPPSLDGINQIVLNFATTGFDWLGEDRPVGVTIGTLDGQLMRFLPFAFRGNGNLDEDAVKRYLQTEVRGKHIINSKTKFDVHHAREWGVDLEAQGNTFGDVQIDAALLDDHRKRFSIDLLAKDYLGGLEVGRVDESMHADYAPADVAERELYTARLVGQLRSVFDPLIAEQDLGAVRSLEEAVIPTVVEMEKNGSPLDVDLLRAMHAECMAEHGRLMLEISREVGFAFEHSASGWKKLFDHLNLPPVDSHKEAVLSKVDHPLIRKGYRAFQYASLDSKTFTPYMKNIDHNGVLHYSINQVASDEGGTVSGRFSIGLVQQVPNHDNHHSVFGLDSTQDAIDACLGDCPLFPRRLFIAAEDEDFLEGDAAQIEFRLLVHYTQNAALLQAYRDNPHMSYHKIMQARLKTYKPDMLYTHTKSYNFAAQYGARSIKLAIMMGFITEDEGAEIRQAKRWNDPRLNLIHEIEAAVKKAHPEAGELLDRASHLAKPECDDYCKKNDQLHRLYDHRGWVKTVSGRRARFVNGYKTYIALNRVLQGSGADIMKKKLVELHRERKNTGFVLRLTNHDAALGGVKKGSNGRQMVETILNSQSFPELKVPILWDVKSGRSWAEAKK